MDYALKLITILKLTLSLELHSQTHNLFTDIRNRTHTYFSTLALIHLETHAHTDIRIFVCTQTYISIYMGNFQKNCIFQVTVKYYQKMIKLLEFLFMEL